jgi:hypothetical protein
MTNTKSYPVQKLICIYVYVSDNKWPKAEKSIFYSNFLWDNWIFPRFKSCWQEYASTFLKLHCFFALTALHILATTIISVMPEQTLSFFSVGHVTGTWRRTSPVIINQNADADCRQFSSTWTCTIRVSTIEASCTIKATHDQRSGLKNKQQARSDTHNRLDANHGARHGARHGGLRLAARLRPLRCPGPVLGNRLDPVQWQATARRLLRGRTRSCRLLLASSKQWLTTQRR